MLPIQLNTIGMLWYNGFYIFSIITRFIVGFQYVLLFYNVALAHHFGKVVSSYCLNRV